MSFPIFNIFFRIFVCAAILTGSFSVRGEVPFALKALHSGKCLSLASTSPSDGVAIVQQPCTGAANQLWFQLGEGLSLAGTEKLSAGTLMPGMVIIVKDNRAAHAAPLVLGTWEFPEGPGPYTFFWDVKSSKVVENSVYLQWQNRLTQRCMDVAWFSQADGASVVQADCTGTDNQMFAKWVPPQQICNTCTYARQHCLSKARRPQDRRECFTKFNDCIAECKP